MAKTAPRRTSANKNTKRSTTSKRSTKAKAWNPRRTKDRRNLIIVVLVFALIGAYFLIHSFAASWAVSNACNVKKCSTSSGKVVDQNGLPVAGVTLVDCDGQTVQTDSNGNYAFTLPTYYGYCTRVSAYPSGVSGAVAYNARPEAGGANAVSYEWQVIGAQCYHNTTYCGAGKIGGNNNVTLYDMAPENILNFRVNRSTTPPPPPPSTVCGNGGAHPAQYAHVVWLWMENKSYSSIMGSSGGPIANAPAPYIASVARQCATATNYGSVGAPSYPNYIGATSGSTQGISSDSVRTLTVDNLFRQVRAKGGSAMSFEESMSGNCSTNDGNSYATKHNPAASYVGGSDHTACLNDDVPLTAFNPNALPTFSFITPNLCDDMHGPCPNNAATIPAGDNWLKGFLPTILNGTNYKQGNTAVIVMWDEVDGGGRPMPNIIIAPNVKAGYNSGANYDHYSLLRSTEEMLGLPFLGGASSASSMRADFNL